MSMIQVKANLFLFLAPRISCSLTVRNVTFHANSTLRNFNSPSFPGAYPLSITCTYLFTAPRGHRIELTFSTFNLEGASPKCTNDYVEVRDGPSEKSTLIKRLCGTIKPVPIISSANSIYLFFESNDKFVFQGFRGTYRTASEGELGRLPAKACAGPQCCLYIVSASTMGHA